MEILLAILMCGLGLAFSVVLALFLYKEKEPTKAPEGLAQFSKPIKA
jgi:cyanate permease